MERIKLEIGDRVRFLDLEGFNCNEGELMGLSYDFKLGRIVLDSGLEIEIDPHDLSSIEKIEPKKLETKKDVAKKSKTKVGARA